MKVSPLPASGVATHPNEASPNRPDTQRITMRVNRTPGSPTEQGAPSATPTHQTGSQAVNPEASAEVEVTSPLSPQFAAFAKQKRALQVKERELADREKELATRASTPSGIDPATLKASPIKVLLENGITYEQLTKAILDNPVNPEMQALKAELAALKAGVDERFTQTATEQEKAALAEMRKEAVVLAATGDTYELVRETGSFDDVMSLIERTYQDSGEVLDVPEALRLVEEDLFQQATKIAQLNKIRGQFPPQHQQRQNPMRTLTNRDNARPVLDRKARALAAFYGTLNK